MDKYTGKHKSVILRILIYSAFILCIEFRAVLKQAKFCRRCPHHVKGTVEYVVVNQR
jgi:hypothetical protein